MAEQAEVTEQSSPKAASGKRLARHASADARLRANANWQRYEYNLSRGHRDYQARAQKCERFYMGDQWDLQTLLELAESDRKAVTDNQIKPMVNTAIGYQIANRMDIQVLPRGYGADDTSAKTMGKTLKYIADDTKLHWRETEVFADGMIMERGYFDVRMSFENNVYGEATVMSLDPIDVMPDPDARDYDPEFWSDVTVDRWMTLDHIEQTFGKAAREAVEYFSTPDIGMEDDGVTRNRFGAGSSAGDSQYMSELLGDSTILYHVIDRQYRVYEPTLCAVYPTGDIRPIPNANPQQRQAYVDQGAILTKRMAKRVKWCVSTRNILLFDDYSPYPWFTIVPFFPYFRRGQTRGMVNDAISPQEALNKGLSQLGHILNTAANSGWIIEQNSLVDMTTEQFRQQAAKNGLLLVVKTDAKHRPEKIKPGEVPNGVLEYIAQARNSLASATGIDQALTASGPMNEMSGVAYQARQYAAQQKLAIPLDNLARTRHLVAQRFIDCVQLFMDAPRVIRIVERDEFGGEQTTELELNTPLQQADGTFEYLNDLTLGEYDLVISEQPMQITFDNSQFEQVKSLVKDFGYPVPPAFALRYSNLSERAELAKAIVENSQVQPDPVAEAKAALAQAQTEKTRAETQNKRIEAVYGATQAGAQIAAIPQIASLADEILQSAGFEDQNAAPIIPQDQQVGAGLAAAAPAQPIVDPANQGQDALDPSTHPTTPENPGVGLHEGIEEPGVQQ